MTTEPTPIGTYTAQADVSPRGGIDLTVFVSTDRGPAKCFRPCQIVWLDEPHATELLGTLAMSLQDLRQRRAS